MSSSFLSMEMERFFGLGAPSSYLDSFAFHYPGLRDELEVSELRLRVDVPGL